MFYTTSEHSLKSVIRSRSIRLCTPAWLGSIPNLYGLDKAVCERGALLLHLLLRMLLGNIYSHVSTPLDEFLGEYLLTKRLVRTRGRLPGLSPCVHLSLETVAYQQRHVSCHVRFLVRTLGTVALVDPHKNVRNHGEVSLLYVLTGLPYILRMNWSLFNLIPQD